MYQDISFLTNDHTGDTYVIADDHCRKMASALSVNLGVETQRALNAEAAIDGRIGEPETGAYILGGNTVNQNLKELDAKVAAFSQDIGTALEEYLDENPLPIDDELDTTSENAVQNAPVATAIGALQTQLGEHTVASDVPAGAVYTDTTYTFATGDVNGQIKVTPAGSTAQHISVKGLGSAAYTNTSAYDANGAATAAVTAHNSSATAHGDIRDAMVTGVLMNGDRVGTTGLIDLGTVVTDVSGKLDVAGGTMTGALTLSGAPSADLHAATKKYVDDFVPTAVVCDTGTIRFGIDANGNYGYMKDGADTVYPFKSWDCAGMVYGIGRSATIALLDKVLWNADPVFFSKHYLNDGVTQTIGLSCAQAGTYKITAFVKASNGTAAFKVLVGHGGTATEAITFASVDDEGDTDEATVQLNVGDVILVYGRVMTTWAYYSAGLYVSLAEEEEE